MPSYKVLLFAMAVGALVVVEPSLMLVGYGESVSLASTLLFAFGFAATVVLVARACQAEQARLDAVDAPSPARVRPAPVQHTQSLDRAVLSRRTIG